MEKYNKIKVIGKGAFGTVHLSLRHTDKKLLILKEISVEDMTKDERVSAFNEVQILKRLNHPNIIKYYENFLDGKNLVIAMEYAQGGTLHQFLNMQTASLKESTVVSLFIQIVVALHHIHSLNILHRDLKTQNILLDKKYKVIKLSDFGISKILDTKTKAFSVVGTPCYISPELCVAKPYNQKSDIWALGCMLYELMTLKKAFEAQSLPALVMKIVQGQYNKDLPFVYNPALTTLLKTMLDLDPEKRPSADEILAESIIMNSLIDLYCSIGAVEVKSKKSPSSAVASGLKGGKTLHHTSSTMSVDMSSKNPCHFCVYTWGGGMSLPVRLPLPGPDTQVIQATIGRTKKACVTESGRLIMWEPTSGTALPGVLGDSQNIPSFLMRFVEGQSGVTVKQVACGDLHTALLTDRGILMTFGSGNNGCLGHGSVQDLDKPTIVEKLLGYELTHIACGSYHMLAVSSDGEVFAWGRGHNGRLGLNDNSTCLSPTQVPLSADIEPVSVHCGKDCSMILTRDNRLLACGSNIHNRLGLDIIENGHLVREVSESSCFAPLRSEPLSQGNVKEVSLGIQHSAVVLKNGQMYTFGNNTSQQLGGSSRDLPPRLPHLVQLENGAGFSKVGCGGTFTVATTDDNKIYSWGKASRGQLGRPVSASSPVVAPDIVSLPSEPISMDLVSLSVCHGNVLLVVSGNESSSDFRHSWDTTKWREEGKSTPDKLIDISFAS